MKKTLLVFCLILLMALAVFARAPQKSMSSDSKATILDTDTWIDANKILMIFSNDGAFATDLGGILVKTDGLYYPYTDISYIFSGEEDRTVVYASGLWIGAVDDGTNDTLICLAEYSEEYTPGPMVGGTFDPASMTNPDFRVYKLYSDSLADNPNDDYTNWPADQGAPVDGDGNPEIIGNQFLWTVYNDADATAHTNGSGSTEPLGIEIQQSVFAFDREDPLGEIVFMQFKVINKGGKDLRDMYVSLWSDPDLGDAGDDLDGCDTVLSLGYVYNGDNNDGSYGSTPPAVGYDFFQGPLEFTGDDADTAKMWGQTWAQYRNLPMSSFAKYINGTDPQNKTETYNYMQGLKPDGSDYTDNNGIVTKFHYAGDPVAGTGSLDTDPADRRFMVTTGPFDFAPGDSTEVLAAIIVGQGGDRLSSVAVMRYNDKFAQLAYDLGFELPEPPAAPIVEAHVIDGQASFEWTDYSEDNPGDYVFEGYSVFQGESAAGPWKLIANYDVANGVALILDEVVDPASGALEQKAVKFGSDNGIQRFFGTNHDYISGSTLNNITKYFYKVEAYSYNSDPQAVPKTMTSATSFTLTPSGASAGTDYDKAYGDTLAVTHTSGISDGNVYPFVIDPLALTGHTYHVIFADDEEGDPVWHIVDATTGVTVLADQPNQTGDQDYLIVDGMFVKVEGPASPGMKDWDIPEGTRRFTWANGADGFGWEGFNGAIGWGGPGDVWGGFDPVPPSEHVSVLLKLATVATDGTFDVNDENVSYGYRYMRGAGDPPATPEIGPLITNPDSYGFQAFEQNVPLSAWNVDVDPPERLAVGFLENNTASGECNGYYFPPDYNVHDNTAGSGTREWLWIFKAPYSETANPDYQLNATDAPMPIMWWSTVARRGDVPFSPGGTGEDQFLILSNHINTAVDTFTFVAEAPTVVATGEDQLDRIKAVPNPYYLYSSYDASVFNRQIRFTNLPEECTIRIFSLSGDQVAKIEKDNTETWTNWDILNTDGVPLASGIYVYLVEAPGFGQKVGKLAIFVEEEQLGQY
ncbi:MAG: hypothetical protein U9N54_01120 [candidate division Zixibacteria bacterium]|nr:hypothetical protein [candidate division Zixibacteria bacterium]